MGEAPTGACRARSGRRSQPRDLLRDGAGHDRRPIPCLRPRDRRHRARAPGGWSRRSRTRGRRFPIPTTHLDGERSLGRVRLGLTRRRLDRHRARAARCCRSRAAGTTDPAPHRRHRRPDRARASLPRTRAVSPVDRGGGSRRRRTRPLLPSAASPRRRPCGQRDAPRSQRSAASGGARRARASCLPHPRAAWRAFPRRGRGDRNRRPQRAARRWHQGRGRGSRLGTRAPQPTRFSGTATCRSTGTASCGSDPPCRSRDRSVCSPSATARASPERRRLGSTPFGRVPSWRTTCAGRSPGNRCGATCRNASSSPC